MASTNEDAAVLAAARSDDGRLLVERHLPDRGSIEIGWWRLDDGGGVAQAPPVLELAAEAGELEAFARLCERAVAIRWDGVGNGEEIAAAGPFTGGTGLVVKRSGSEVAFLRPPERDNLVSVPRAMLEGLVARVLPAARQRLVALGFGLPQQEEAEGLNRAINFWSP
jgi:hypothetical protein